MRFAVRRALLLAATLAIAALTIGPGFAADAWPTRPVRLIVTLGRGSGVDISARMFADKLSSMWHQPVVVENRPGGDGIVAITSFLGAHDDHTLLVSPVSSFTAHPYFHDTLPYDPKDMIPVALAKKEPGKLNWTTATGFTDFVFAGFLHTVGLKMEKVPYKNPAGAANDLAAGTIQVYMPAFAIVRPQVAAGKVKVLAVTNHSRAPALPETPTATQAGYPSLAFDGLVGIFGSPELPAAARTRIANDVREVAKDPAILAKMTATGQIVMPGDGKEFTASIDQQRAQVAAVAKLFGNKPVH